MMKRLILAALAAFTCNSSATAQLPGDGLSIYIACTQMGELARGLDSVVNEMQLYNNSRDIWRASRGCRERDPRDVKVESIRFLGWYLTTPARSRDPQFWVPIYYVEYNSTRQSRQLLPGVTISEENRMFRPHAALRADRWSLPRGCEAKWVERPERYKPIKLHGTDRQGGIADCETPEYTGRGFREGS